MVEPLHPLIKASDMQAPARRPNGHNLRRRRLPQFEGLTGLREFGRRQ
jgi:hypothetical protein